MATTGSLGLGEEMLQNFSHNALPGRLFLCLVGGEDQPIRKRRLAISDIRITTHNAQASGDSAKGQGKTVTFEVSLAMGPFWLAFPTQCHPKLILGSRLAAPVEVSLWSECP